MDKCCVVGMTIFGFDDIHCIQAQISGAWWERDGGKQVRRGRLAYALVPHIENVTRTLVPEDPEHPDHHFQVCALDVNKRYEDSLRIKGLPRQRGGSTWGLHPYKRRPVLFIGLNGIPIQKAHSRNRASKWQYARTYTVLPYYSVGSGATAGWNIDFVKAIQCATYPQYLWEKLPNGDPNGSILRFDNAVTLGCHVSNYKLSKYYLSNAAMELVDEWFAWCQTGTLALPEKGELRVHRELLRELALT